MRVALFGGTGFVGSYLIDALSRAGHEPSLLVRAGSEGRIDERSRCRVVSGHIGAADAVTRTLDGCDAVIYNIGILEENPDNGITFQALQYDGARAAIDAATAAGVRRFVLMSANGVKAEGTAYQETKFGAERYLAQSGLDHTVFRPSVIFGDPRGRMEFCTQLVEQMIRPPLPVPDFFRGRSPRTGGIEMSPVHVRDVAAAFVNALRDQSTVGQTLLLCGPEVLSWREIVTRIAAACGREKKILPVPIGPVIAIAGLLERFEFFPATRDQLVMLMEGNTGDSSEIFQRLGIEPHRFDATALAYLSTLLRN